MTPEQWELVKDLYSQAEILPSEEREAFIARQVTDPVVAREVIRLLRFTASDALLDHPPTSDGLVRQIANSLGSSALAPGEILGDRFRMIRLVGSGGMGEVYEALDLTLRSTIAIKTIRPEIAADAQVVTRFQREIGLARQVTHANVCRLFEFLTATRASDGQTVQFLTMEFLKGETLAQLLTREHKLTLTQALPILEQLTSGLAAAHRAGIVHRDLKSSNIFLTQDQDQQLRVVVTDFGLARSIGPTSDSLKTASSWVAGTPAYMAPEQLEGKSVGPAADIYSLGVVMYEMATGKIPHGGDSPMQVAIRRLRERPRVPREIDPTVDPKWEAVILRCLEVHPEDRYPAPTEILPALHTRRLLPRIRRRNYPRLAFAAALLLAMLATAGWLFRQANPEPPPAAGQGYREGIAALQEGSLATASRALSDVVRRVPDWPLGHARLAQVYDELDQPDRARLEILRAIQNKPAFGLPAVVIEAIQALISKDYPAAEKSFRQAVNRTSGAAHSDALLDLAKCLERAEKPRLAAAALDQLLAEDGAHSSANLLRAQLAIRLREPAPVIDRYFANARNSYRAFSRPEGLSQTGYQLAGWHFERQNLPAATLAVNESLRYAETANSPWLSVRALFMKGRIDQSALREDEARAAANHALELGRQNRFGETLAQGLIDLGILSFAHGKTKEALDLYESAEAEATKWECWRTKARAGDLVAHALTFLRRFDEAEEKLNESQTYFTANALEADSLRCTLRLSLIRQRQGRRAEARDLMLRAHEGAVKIANEQVRLTAALRLADLALSQGEFPEALQRFQEFARVSRDNGFKEDEFTGRRRTGDTYQQLGEFALARAEFDSLSQDPRFTSRLNRLQIEYQRAMLDTEEGHHDAALARYVAMLAEARQEKLTTFLHNIENGYCAALIAAHRPTDAQKACGPAFFDPKEKDTPFSYLQADQLLLERRFPEARTWAEGARAANVKIGNRDNAFYSLLIRGQAESRSHDPRLAATTADADHMLQDFVQRWGLTPARTYLSRPLYQSRWDEIHQPPKGNPQ